MKFDRLLQRAGRLGFDRLATGHHARVTGDGVFRLRRGADPAKDQSYVLSMLGQDALARVVFPVGEMTKDEVRAHARRLGLRTAAKPDSQDVCFIGRAEGRQGFLSEHLALHPAEVVDVAGRPAGAVEAVELVTVGQRRGMGHGSDGKRRYVTAVDVAGRRVTVGGAADVLRSTCRADHAVAHLGRPTAGAGCARRGSGQRARPARPVHLDAGRRSAGPGGALRRPATRRGARARRSPSTTARSPTPWSAPASPPDRGGRRRAGPARNGGEGGRAARADRAGQRAVPRARLARDPRRRVRPAGPSSCAGWRRTTRRSPPPTHPPTPWARHRRASSKRCGTGCP